MPTLARLFGRLIAVALVGSSLLGAAQESADSPASPARLRSQMDTLQQQLHATSTDLSAARQEIQELRQQIAEIRAAMGSPTGAGAPAPNPLAPNPYEAAKPASVGQAISGTGSEDQALLASQIEEIRQVKVESASKYPVKFSGMILLNAYSNRGAVDITDIPGLAFPHDSSHKGDFGMTLRQTLLGLDVRGPEVAGAKTSANVRFDFYGGFPSTFYGTSAGMVRLRTAAARMDWENTSLVLAQESPFFSPNSPTSLANVGQPAFAWSGNLWVWTPQVYLEHRISTGEHSSLLLQGGILAPLTEEIPYPQGHDPGAGERSRQPGFAARIAATREFHQHPLTVGFGAFTSQQRYNTQGLRSYAVTADWAVPLGHNLSVSGEFYRGRAVGGLGGNIWASVIYSSSSIPSAVHALNGAGGWTQLKFEPFERWEFNAAIGQDSNFGRDLLFFGSPPNGTYFAPMSKNQSGFVNLIYKPRSNLRFSAEYRRIQTYTWSAERSTADHINLGAGVSF